MKRRTEIISFRADESLLRRIDEACEAIGLSRGDWVREIVITYLHALEEVQEWPAQIADFRHAVEELGQLLLKLTGNQRRALFILLTTIGEMSAEEAKEIVKCQLKS